MILRDGTMTSDRAFAATWLGILLRGMCAARVAADDVVHMYTALLHGACREMRRAPDDRTLVTGVNRRTSESRSETPRSVMPVTATTAAAHGGIWMRSAARVEASENQCGRPGHDGGEAGEDKDVLITRETVQRLP